VVAFWRWGSREIRTPATHQREARVAAEATEVTWWPGCREKPLAVRINDGPYRKPPQVGRGKDLKVDERSSVKELGKLAP
jgi:hypothetical protein